MLLATRLQGNRNRALLMWWLAANRSSHSEAGADPGFFSGGGALVSCSTSTIINHIVFFTTCIRKPQVIPGGGWVRTPCTLPLDSPLRGYNYNIPDSFSCWHEKLYTVQYSNNSTELNKSFTHMGAVWRGKFLSSPLSVSVGSNPLPFYTPFSTEKIPLSYSFYW